MTDSSDTSAPRDSSPSEPVVRVRWWVAGVTAVGGLILGVLLTGLLIGTTPDFGSAARDAGQAPAPGNPQPSEAVPVTAEARVNAACLRVINDAQDVYRIISGVGEAAADVDLQRLDDIVRRLQPLEARLERDLLGCRVDTSIDSSADSSPAAPIPTVPQPSSSSTR